MLVFALFFGVFMVESGQNLAEFHAGRESLATGLIALNTLMLLTGSVCVGDEDAGDQRLGLLVRASSTAIGSTFI
jgi:heme/copper-type cytochrome/quinol oxidase subunit 3